MSWKERAEVLEDVTFFRYATPGLEQRVSEVFIWDLDKTYLDTDIHSISQLLSVALERSFLKKNIPGTSTLLRSLSADYVLKKNLPRFPLYFISASPPQMEVRISEKFFLDGIKPFGCFYKDNLKNLTPARLWRLNKQVGYKVQALMQLRTLLKENVKQICWGDDSESDAIIYNLYSDICSRRMSQEEIRSTLQALSVSADQIEVIFELQASVPENDPIEKIYINLAVDTDADYYLKFGRRTLPTSNTFEVALDLVQNGLLPIEALLSIGQDMIVNYKFTAELLGRSVDEMVRRKVIGETGLNLLKPYLIEQGFLSRDYKPTVSPAKEVQASSGRFYGYEGASEPWVPERIDYLHDH